MERALVIDKFVPVNTPWFDGNEKKYLNECIDTGWVSSEGKFVAQFEKMFAAKVGRKFATTVTNGTAALELVISNLGLNPGDEVILPTFTIISCITQIIRLGAVPILVDCDPDHWNMTVDSVAKKITARTKAIIVVHIYGLPVDLDPILNLAFGLGIKVIEDAAEMHGQTYKNKPCGSFGLASTFSFYPNKHITTGEGGMIVTDDEEYFEKLKAAKNLYFGTEHRYEHTGIGWNMRMTNLQAALGLAQLEQLDKFVQKKKEMGKLYSDLLAKSKIFDLPPNKSDFSSSIFWVYGLRLKPEINVTPVQVIKRLAALGVGSRQFFCPMHKQPILQDLKLFKNESYPNSEYLYDRGFYIPSGLGLNREDIDFVVTKLFTLEEELT